MNKTLETTNISILLNRFLEMRSRGVMLILITFIILVAIVSDGRFFSIANITNILRSISVQGVIACGVAMVMLTRNIDLSVGSILSLTTCICSETVKYGIVPAVVVPIIVGIICGIGNGILVGIFKLNSFIVTIGTLSVYQAISLIYSNNMYLIAASNDIFRFIGQGYFWIIPMPIFILAIALVISHFILTSSVFGTKLYAVGSNPESSRFSGISESRTVIIAYALAGLATAIGGVILCSRTMAAQATAGAGYEFAVLTALVVGGFSISGGKGNIPGALLGVLFIGVLFNGFVLMGIPSTAQFIAVGVILIVALRFDVIGFGLKRRTQ